MAFWNRHNVSDLSESELLQLYRDKQDMRCIAALSQRYSHLMYGVCLSYLKDEEEAKDAVMDVLEQLIEKLKQHEVKNFKSWLFSVCKNHCLMALRSRSVQLNRQEKYLRIVGDDVETDTIEHLDDGDLPLEEDLERLEQAIQKLKHEQRVCVELFYLQGKSYQEVVELTGYEMKKVKSYIQNGKRNLRISLGDINDKTG